MKARRIEIQAANADTRALGMRIKEAQAYQALAAEQLFNDEWRAALLEQAAETLMGHGVSDSGTGGGEVDGGVTEVGGATPE